MHWKWQWLVNEAKHTLGDSKSSHSWIFVQPQERTKATFTFVPLFHLRKVTKLHSQQNLMVTILHVLSMKQYLSQKGHLFRAQFCNCKPYQIFHNPFFIICPALCETDTVYLGMPTAVLLVHTSENIKNHSLESALPLQQTTTPFTISVRRYCIVNLQISWCQWHACNFFDGDRLDHFLNKMNPRNFTELQQ